MIAACICFSVAMSLSFISALPALAELAQYHASTWTGEEMVLWDGTEAYAYSPAKDEWRQLSASPWTLVKPERDDDSPAMIPAGVGRILCALIDEKNVLSVGIHRIPQDDWKELYTLDLSSGKLRPRIRTVAKAEDAIYLLIMPFPDHIMPPPAIEKELVKTEDGIQVRVVTHSGWGHPVGSPAFYSCDRTLFLSQDEEKSFDGFILEAGKPRWENLPEPPLCPMGRGGFAHAFNGREVFIFGGYPTWSSAISRYEDGGFMFSIPERRWVEMPRRNAPPHQDYLPSICWTPTGWFAFSGEWQAGVRIFDIKANEWVSLPTDGSPTPRKGADCFCTGKEVLIWGGSGPRYKVLHDGGVFDLDKQTWRSMAPVPYTKGRVIDFKDPVYQDYKKTSIEDLKKMLDEKSRFLKPYMDTDQHGNPVAKRSGKTEDSDTGLPLEIWLDRPRMEFVFIPAGTFIMGSPPEDLMHNKDEVPSHEVRITSPFYISKYETTKAQWEVVLGPNPSYKAENKNLQPGPDFPAVRASWHESREFCLRLGLALPTEAQWERACKAGRTARHSIGDSEEDLKRIAWFSENSAGHMHHVGVLASNAWGLYDILGNVEEWCEDSYSESFYSTPDALKPDPCCPRCYPPNPVRRGGSYWMIPRACRCAFRGRGAVPVDAVGFRPALLLE